MDLVINASENRYEVIVSPTENKYTIEVVDQSPKYEVVIGNGGGGGGNVLITRSDSTVIANPTAPSTYPVADSIVTLRNSANNVLSTTNVKADSTADITAPNATVLVNGDNSFPTIPSGGLENIGVENTNGAPVGAFDSNTNSWVVGDSVVANSDNSYQVSLPATDSLALPDIDYTIVDENNVVLDTFTRPSLKNEIIDVTSYCAGATVENSDLSYVNTVASGGTLLLPDTNYDIFVAGSLTPISFSLPTLKNETINIVWQ
jgi:hypothetical protein